MTFPNSGGLLILIALAIILLALGAQTIAPIYAENAPPPKATPFAASQPRQQQQ